MQYGNLSLSALNGSDDPCNTYPTGTIQGHMYRAQLELIQKGGIKGLNAHCVSNLIWAIVKLDVASDPLGPGYELIRNSSSLVMYFLSTSSSQARLLMSHIANGQKVPRGTVDSCS